MFIAAFFCYNINCESISTDNSFAKYKRYCGSVYKKFAVPKKYTMNKLLVFHRHGDRSSLNVEYSSWKDEMCMVSSCKNNMIIDCKERKCKDGELTIKGYEQMKKLGQFIKKNYGNLLDGEVFLRCTSIERTQSSLHGVLTELFDGDTDKKVMIAPYNDDTLLINKDCLYLREQITNRITSNFSAIASKDKFLKTDQPQRRADIYLTAICNDIDLDCKTVNCDKSIVEDYISTSFRAWEDQAYVLSRDEHVLKLTFGRFVDDLKDAINSTNKLSIFSVHDSTLSLLLAGFDIDKKEHPSYASAIFVEILADETDRYLRIIYNTQIERTTIDESLYIPLKKFIAYLNELKADKEFVDERCKKGLILNEEKIEKEMNQTKSKNKK